MKKDKKTLLKKALNLPERPGVYTFYDEHGKVIYVGKAKNLKNRVTTYFQGNLNPKTAKMVSTAGNFEFIVTNTELQALLTECSLIKQHNPFFNIKLKDSTSYPYIRVRHTPMGPSIETVYSRTGDGKFFGPYGSRHNATAIRDLLKRTFSLASCANKKTQQKKLCLEYHIKHCSGFCEHKIPEDKVEKLYSEIYSVLNGKTDEIYAKTEKEMKAFAKKLDFESAAILRDRLKALDILKKRQKPLVIRNTNADYVSCVDSNEVGISSENPILCVFMFKIRNGYVTGELCDVFENTFETPESLISGYLSRYYNDCDDMPKSVYCNITFPDFDLINEWLNGKLKLPKQEQDKSIIELAKKNCKERILQHQGKAYKSQRLLASFREFTGLKKADNIEVYDVSHIAGENVVCGMISCVNGKLKKDNYKRFKISKENGNDDTAYMKEAVQRRITRFLENDKKFEPLPDVIICDGGLGQIHAVLQAVKISPLPITVIGLKKDSRHRTKSIVFENGKELLLSHNHEVFAFCGNLQEEVHRYAISYHKKLRDIQARQSELFEIDGVGKTRAKNLFLHFKSIEKIKNASVEELKTVKGITDSVARNIKKYFMTHSD